MADPFTVFGASIRGSNELRNFLSQQELGFIEHQSIYVNGLLNTISFVTYFFKRKFTFSVARQKFHEIFMKKDYLPFDKTTQIAINDQWANDITDEIVLNEEDELRIPFYKLYERKGQQFTIIVRGPFMDDFTSLYEPSYSFQPNVKTEEENIYYITILVFNKKYPAKDIIFINIPFKYRIYLDFLAYSLFSERELKSFQIIQQNLKKYTTIIRIRNQLRQEWGFDVEELNTKISKFLFLFEGWLKRNLSQYIEITSEKQKVMFSNIEVSFPGFQETFPKIYLTPIICFDYKEEDDKVIKIKISMKKKIVTEAAINIWSDIKRASKVPDHPRRTF